MQEVIPFRGIRYNTNKVRLEEVVAPPYDVISQKARRKLFERSPYNVVRLILPQGVMGDDKYSQANIYLKKWLSEGILVPEDKPSFYILEETFPFQREEVTRVGFIGLLKLRKLGDGVYPHENTIGKVKRDRFRLLEACKANFSQILMLYSDNALTLESIHKDLRNTPPHVEVRDDEGVLRRMWVVNDPESVDTLKNLLSDKDIVIADGHHRYETALEFMRKSHVYQEQIPYNYVMAYFTNVKANGVVSLPTHRLLTGIESNLFRDLLKKLEENFEVRTYPFTSEDKYKVEKEFLKELRKEGYKKPSIGLLSYYDNKFRLILADPDRLRNLFPDNVPESLMSLDVVILNEIILRRFLNIDISNLKLEDIRCTSNPYKAVDCVLSQRYQIAFLLNPLPVDRIIDLATKGHLLPQKSTYFYPKLLSGLVMRTFEIQ